MAVEVDMNRFHLIGKVVSIDGIEYMILIEDGLPRKRAIEIQRQCNENKLDIKGHVYDPGKEIREKLRSDMI